MSDAEASRFPGILPLESMMDHLLIRTARGEKVERPPVWAMRQAGRWDPKFNALRQGMGFFEFSENVELSIECSLLPKRFGVDAIILFYDITTLPFAMGQRYTLRPNRGPVPDVPIRSMADVDRLADEPAPETFRHILDLLTGVKKKLAGELPVLVFAGAPFTVATYSIGTGKDLEATRRFIHENPATWHALLEKLQHATGHFLRTLIAAGADGYQLFDSWAGMLEPAEYDAWAQPHHAAILRAATGVPRILFVKEGPYLEKMVETGAEIISLGVRDDLAKARHEYPHLVFQGNVDEEILRTGTTEEVKAATRRCLDAGGGHRHIVNLNHGVDRTTPVANFQAFIETVQAYR